ncbi:hypothetical protein B0I00_2485 [Novosphingobium kunmingense]|uniref:Uncharacterized protein n=1 Tax=Novosphingobium kunmingense TaxID=1211806 RepID=A0A2N0H7G4_9SPHN|nr:hypothetical protein B0I00_2485 [Novosphingobium kunmingense]
MKVNGLSWSVRGKRQTATILPILFMAQQAEKA